MVCYQTPPAKPFFVEKNNNEVVFHLNLSGADAGPHNDIRQLHQVQDVPFVTAQAHCLCICIAFVYLLFLSFSL